MTIRMTVSDHCTQPCMTCIINAGKKERTNKERSRRRRRRRANKHASHQQTNGSKETTLRKGNCNFLIFVLFCLWSRKRALEGCCIKTRCSMPLSGPNYTPLASVSTIYASTPFPSPLPPQCFPSPYLRTMENCLSLA